MTQPLRMNKPEMAFPVERPAPPPWASDIVAGSTGRYGVPTRGWALLVLVDRLCRNTGFCYMSQKNLAPQIGVKPRQLRYLLAMLVEKGHLKIRHPRGMPPEMWILSWPAPPAPPAAPAPALAREGGTPPPPPAPPAPQPESGERKYWKPNRFIKTDAPRQLSDAVRSGLVLFTTHEHRRRRLVKVTHNASFATLFITDETSPDAPPAEVRVAAAAIGANPYWR